MIAKTMRSEASLNLYKELVSIPNKFLVYTKNTKTGFEHCLVYDNEQEAIDKYNESNHNTEQGNKP